MSNFQTTQQLLMAKQIILPRVIVGLDLRFAHRMVHHGFVVLRHDAVPMMAYMRTCLEPSYRLLIIACSS